MSAAKATLDGARELVARRFPVFPLHWPRADGSCSCARTDCGSVGKHPRTQHGFKDASLDPAQIDQWWIFGCPNIGIPTGSDSGIVVVDADGATGAESLKKLRITTQPTARTGSGGSHHYFQHPGYAAPNFTAKLPGLDFRGDGGYVVAPPSLHASGECYKWVAGGAPDVKALPELPDAVRELLAGQAGADEVNSASMAADVTIPEGSRNSELASIAGRLRKAGLEELEICAALVVVNAQRCRPPLESAEIERIARSIGGYPPGSPKAGDGPLTVVRGDKIELTQQRCLWYPYLAPAYVTILAGKTKHGKSYIVARLVADLTRGEALPEVGSLPGTLLADGSPWMVLEEPRPRRVLVLCTEDRAADIRVRLEQHEADLSQVFVVEEVFTLDAVGLPRFEAVIEEYRPDVVILDPLLQYTPASVREHDPKTVRAFVAPLDALMKKHGVALIAVMHLQKTGKDQCGVDPIETIAGSHQWGTVARSLMFALRDAKATNAAGPSGATIGTLYCPGTNLGRGTDVGLRYSICDDGLTWLGNHTETLDEALRAAAAGQQDPSRLDEAVEFLQDVLRGWPVRASVVTKWAEEAGITCSTLNRAKARAGVKCVKTRQNGAQVVFSVNGNDVYVDWDGKELEPSRWYWVLASNLATEDPKARTEDLDHLDQLTDKGSQDNQVDQVLASGVVETVVGGAV